MRFQRIPKRFLSSIRTIRRALHCKVGMARLMEGLLNEIKKIGLPLSCNRIAGRNWILLRENFLPKVPLRCGFLFTKFSGLSVDSGERFSVAIFYRKTLLPAWIVDKSNIRKPFSFDHSASRQLNEFSFGSIQDDRLLKSETRLSQLSKAIFLPKN